MTEFTVRLRTDGPTTRATAYQIYGEIANVLTALDDVELVDITDDIPACFVPAVTPKPARKPRGPNKAKVLDGGAVGAEQKPDPAMPDFLKRGA